MASIPLRIDKELVNQARASGLLAERPATAQIEFWAKIGRVVEAVITGESSLKVKQLGRVAELEEVLALSRTEKGREKAREVVNRHKGPIYSADPDDPTLVVETRHDGTTRRGRFANRRFTELPSAAQAH